MAVFKKDSSLKAKWQRLHERLGFFVCGCLSLDFFVYKNCLLQGNWAKVLWDKWALYGFPEVDSFDAKLQKIAFPFEMIGYPQNGACRRALHITYCGVNTLLQTQKHCRAKEKTILDKDRLYYGNKFVDVHLMDWNISLLQIHY